LIFLKKKDFFKKIIFLSFKKIIFFLKKSFFLSF